MNPAVIDLPDVDWSSRSRVVDSVLDAAGLTPMVRLGRVGRPLSVEILLKLEYIGPSGSVKDRIVPWIVDEAERLGSLRPGMRIIEGTTGNTGIATAMVAAAKGYGCVIVMPEGMSKERQRTIRAYGAELALTPGGESDVDLVLEYVHRRKAERPGEFFEIAQFTNPANPEAHYRATAPEIWAQAQGRIGCFIAAQGSGGTLSGVAKYLKERDSRIRIYAAEPFESPILSGGAWGPHGIEGIGDGFIPDVLTLDLLDGVVTVSSHEALDMARRLAREEGIFCGISSGCNVAAALKVGRMHPALTPIVTLANDNGLRYLSTALCDGGSETFASPERPHELTARDHERLAAQRLEVIS